MAREDASHRLDRFQGAGFIVVLSKRALHRPADGLPLCLRHLRSDAAVRDDLDPPVDELHVDQHAAVLRGVPDAKLGKHLARALAGRQSKRMEMERALDGEADLAAMRALGALYRLLDLRERRRGEGAQRDPVRREEMLQRARDHHEPLAPPPPELPPPPLNPPPPPPPQLPPPKPPLLQPPRPPPQ